MRTLIRSTITAIIRRIQRWQQARAFRAECHYNRQAVQAYVTGRTPEEHARIDAFVRRVHTARHTWE